MDMEFSLKSFNIFVKFAFYESGKNIEDGFQ